jgi:hypothetical protein
MAKKTTPTESYPSGIMTFDALQMMLRIPPDVSSRLLAEAREHLPKSKQPTDRELYSREQWAAVQARRQAGSSSAAAKRSRG